MKNPTKLTWFEMCELIKAHNSTNHIESQYSDDHPLKCYVVYKASNWKEPFSLEARTYVFRSDEKYFLPKMGGNSIYADALDGSDDGVRLDWYRDWKIDYCYIEGA